MDTEKFQTQKYYYSPYIESFIPCKQQSKGYNYFFTWRSKIKEKLQELVESIWAKKLVSKEACADNYSHVKSIRTG